MLSIFVFNIRRLRSFLCGITEIIIVNKKSLVEVEAVFYCEPKTTQYNGDLSFLSSNVLQLFSRKFQKKNSADYFFFDKYSSVANSFSWIAKKIIIDK